MDNHIGKVAPICEDTNDHPTNVAHTGSGIAPVFVYDRMTDAAGGVMLATIEDNGVSTALGNTFAILGVSV